VLLRTDLALEQHPLSGAAPPPDIPAANAFAVGPSGEILVHTGDALHVYAPGAVEPRLRLDASAKTTRAMLVAPSGSHALAHGKGSVDVWDLARGHRQFFRTSFRIDAPAFSPDGGRIAWIADGRVEVRETEGLRLVLAPPAEGATALSWSADGHTLHVAYGRVVRDFDAAPLDLAGLMWAAGAATNLRLCRDGFRIARVAPWPEPDSPWAPAEACR
jgi:hypothetical protein